MKARELLHLLNSLTIEQLELDIYSDGCDCTGLAVGLCLYEDEDVLLIARDNPDLYAASDLTLIQERKREEEQRQNELAEAQVEKFRGYEHILP